MSDENESNLTRNDSEDGSASQRVEMAAKKKGRRGKVIILGWLVLLLVAISAVLGYYLVSKKPITQMPAVQAMTRNLAPTYLFSIYNVTNPFGVAVSPDGQKIYVSEARGERQVRIFDRNGTQLFAFGPPDSTPTTRRPAYLAVAPDGSVYVGDQFKNAILRFTPEGKYIGTFHPNGDSNFNWAPLGLGFDAKGNAYVTDVLNEADRIVVLGPDARFKVTMGKRGSDDGQLYAPQQAVADKNGRIFVSDMVNARVVAFGPDGRFLANFGSGMSIPQGMAIDDMGRLYVVDNNGPNVQVFDLANDFKPLFTFGSEGSGDGQFKFPRSVAVDKTGRVYVADFRNNRVQVWGY